MAIATVPKQQEGEEEQKILLKQQEQQRLQMQQLEQQVQRLQKQLKHQQQGADKRTQQQQVEPQQSFEKKTQSFVVVDDDSKINHTTRNFFNMQRRLQLMKAWNTLQGRQKDCANDWLYPNGCESKGEIPLWIRRQQQQEDLVSFSSLSFNKTNHITLATHGGVSKLDRILLQAKWWGGPVSAAIYIHNLQELETLLSYVEQPEQHPFASLLANNNYNISMHYLMEIVPPSLGAGSLYPHNKLRNLALDSVVTDYVLPIDADFVTNPNAHDDLYHLIHNNHKDIQTKLQSEKVLLALPPFRMLLPTTADIENGPDYNDYKNMDKMESLLPKTKQQVIQQVQNGTMDVFYRETNTPATHAFYNYNEWLSRKEQQAGSNNSTTNERKDDADDYMSSSYHTDAEPYVVAYRHGLPPYHEDFRGFGHNKVSWLFRLAKVEKYKFAVLSNFYLCHIYHPEVNGTARQEGHQRNLQVLQKYKQGLYGRKRKLDLQKKRQQKERR